MCGWRVDLDEPPRATGSANGPTALNAAMRRSLAGPRVKRLTDTAGAGRTITQLNLGPFRKEVIQPQVPLRLPCYDFTPVADLTVDGCPPCGLAHRLRVKPTPMV